MTLPKQLDEEMNPRRVQSRHGALGSGTIRAGEDNWLGDLPEGWSIRPLKHATKIDPQTLAEETDPSFRFRYVDIGNVDEIGGISDWDEVTFEAAPTRARKLVQAGDTIISTVRTYLRAIAFIEDRFDDVVVSTGFSVLRPRTSIIPEYLWRVMQSQGFVDTVVANSVGVSYPAISSSRLGSVHIPIPPLGVQRAIAAYLDRETAKIDALIEKKQRLIELLEEKRTALISHAVTKGLNPGAPMKDSGVEWLGEIPEHWAATHVKVGYDVQLGKMLSPRPSRASDVKMPYLRAANVQWNGVDTGDVKEMWFSHSELRDFEIEDGDLLVCEGGDVGRAAIWDGSISPCFIQNSLHRTRPHEGFSNRFLYYWLFFAKELGIIDLLCSKATISHFTKEKYRGLELLAPPLDEQESISRQLDAECGQLEVLIAKTLESIELLNEYRTALISDAVSGKIDVRDEIEVPA